jgi:CheY-like chemotaxis protein
MQHARNHILVVDDLADAADSTVELLSVWGYNAIACYGGATALKSASIRRPDVVLLDLAMPRMDGFQFTGLFHELPKCSSVPIIALSGYSSQACRSKARELGILHYLLKPVDPKCLKDLLARTIVSTSSHLSLYADAFPRLAVEMPRPKSRILRRIATQLCPAPLVRG